MSIDTSMSTDRRTPAAAPSFAALGLPQRLVTALERNDIRAPFAIQTLALPDALAGRDVLGRARTGSGKTLAFGLPLLARLSSSHTPGRAPRALVLVPTRELAVQVRDVLEPLGHAVGLKVVAIFGGASMGRQRQALQRGLDVIVATPGRLQDFFERGDARLDEIEVSVLDEADFMADLGFLPVVSRLLDATPAHGQRLLFSATLDGAVTTIVRRYLTNPVTHSVEPAAASTGSIDHRAYIVSATDKVAVLAAIASRPARTLMFVRTKHGADRLATQLGRLGVEATAIHGNLNQNQRQRALAAFTYGECRVLVATDVAARGIHVDDVDLVVHVDPPSDHKDYVHRSGRTARAGASGTVVSILLPEQVRPSERLRQRAGVKVKAIRVDPGHPAVRELATSGEPVVVVPRPAPEPVTHRPAGRSRRPARAGSGTGGRRGSASAAARPASAGRPRRRRTDNPRSPRTAA
ncbi:MAG TPA: DEAD/DEAH box helicase [Actinomycetes bacterium]|nr:DEAD/DEAH box helicase [Actinomycetes bacterium]